MSFCWAEDTRKPDTSSLQNNHPATLRMYKIARLTAKPVYARFLSARFWLDCMDSADTQPFAQSVSHLDRWLNKGPSLESILVSLLAECITAVYFYRHSLLTYRWPDWSPCTAIYLARYHRAGSAWFFLYSWYDFLATPLFLGAHIMTGWRRPCCLGGSLDTCQKQYSSTYYRKGTTT